MRLPILALAFMALPVSVVAQKAPTLEVRIKAELLNQTFRTKLALGNVLLRHGVPESEAMRLVDTNVFPDGRVLFNLRTSWMYVLINDARAITSPTCAPNRPWLWTRDFLEGDLCQVNAGATVRVIQVDLNDDRLEVYLATPQGHYAKLKFLFGKGWQKSMDLETVITGVSRGLRIERIERANAIASEYEQLQRQLQAFLSAEAAPAEKRLEDVRGIRTALNSLIRNRSEFEALGKGSPAKEIGDYRARAVELDAEVVRLEAEIRKSRINKILTDYSTAEAEAVGWRATLSGAAPRTPSEVKAREDLLVRWEASLRTRDELEKALSSFGEPTVAQRGVTRDLEQQDIQRIRVELEAIGPKVLMAETNLSYTRMKSQETRLKAAYVAAFATPGQRTASTEFRNHLQAMIANREAVQRLGDATAAAEIRRLRTQIAAIR